MPTHVYYLLSYSGTDELCYKKQESKKLLAEYVLA
jgi:chaperone required for assembly of F1-ATPase